MGRANAIEDKEGKMARKKKTDVAIAETSTEHPRTFGYIVGNKPDDQEFPQDLLESEEVTAAAE